MALTAVNVEFLGFHHAHGVLIVFVDDFLSKIYVVKHCKNIRKSNFLDRVAGMTFNDTV